MRFHRPADGHGLAHDPFLSILAPRPIGWISTVSPRGVPNLAPYSFCTAFSSRPPLIGFSSVGRKDTLRNAEATGEFTWNLVTRDLLAAMNATSTGEPVDEWQRAGLVPAPCELVRSARVEGSPAAFECLVTDVHRLRDAAGADTGAHLVVGEVVGVHLDERMLVDGVYETAEARPVLRGGSTGTYWGLGARTELDRPS